MAFQQEATEALSTSQQLESRAREQYSSSDFASPGTLTYTISLNESETLVWLYAWCATTQEILEENFESIQLRFTLDGEEVPLDDMATQDVPNNGQQCRIFYTALSDWPAGEHRLSTAATFTNPINDGTADYEAGEYVLEYTVYVNE
jgi:hypothetical protein